MLSRLVHSSIPFWAMAAALAACQTGGSLDNNPFPGNGDEKVLSGNITESATLSGAILIEDDTVIQPGVIITVEAGSSIEGAAGKFLKVQGTLDIEGKADQPISITGLAGATFGGITVEAGGSATIRHATGQDISSLLYCRTGALVCTLDFIEFSKVAFALQAEGPATISNSRITNIVGGGVSVRAGATVSIVNSYVNNSVARGDLVVMSGGSLTIDHAYIGETDPSGYDHCGLHINSADSLVITNSILASSVIGMMIGGTNGAKINQNNIMLNSTDIQEIGANVNVDLRQNYWDKNPPNLGPNYDTSGAVATPYAGAGPNF